MPPATNEIFDQIDTNNDGIITRSEFNGAVVAIQRPPSGPINSGATANAIFDRIDVNHDGRITRSEFNSHVAVQRQVPMATATARVPSRPQRAEVISCDLSREVQLAVRSCMETERNLWHTSPQFDEIIASKVSAWFRQLKGEELQKSESVAAHFEGTVAKLREEFDTLRSSQSANTEKIQQEVEELHTLRHLVESRMSEVCQTHRDTDEVSRELHSQISLRLGKNHEGLCSLLEKEQQQRSQDIKELSDTLGSRVTEYLNQESHERASQLEDLSRRVEADSIERLAKLAEQQSWQTEVEGTNQELVTHVLELREVYRTLENAFNQFFGENTEKHDAVRNRHDQLESLIGTHHEKWESDCEKMSEDLNMKINELRSCHQRMENIASMEKERNNTRHRESGEDLNAKYTRIMEVFDEERAAWEAKIHELQPKVDTALFRLSAFDAEFKGGLDGAHNKMQETASNLETSFLTRQQQCINQTEAATQQLAKVFKDEIAQRDFNIQQLQNSLQDEILRAVAKCDAYKEECMKEFGTMQKSLESGHGDLLSTISNRATSQEVRDLVVATRSELEKCLQEQDGRLQHLHVRLGEFHENLKTKEDVQAEHSRSLESERNARSQQVKDLEEYISSQLSNAKIQMGDRTEIGTMLELERQSRNDMLSAEASNRARALDELTNRVVEHVNMSIQGEKNERDAHFKNLLERLESQSAQHKEHTERFEDHGAQHMELLSSHQELMSLTRALEASHAALSTRLEDVHEMHRDNFIQHASNHKTALLEQENTLQKKYDAAIDDLRILLQGIESTTNLDRSAHHDRHTEFKCDVEAKLKELESVIQGNRSLWEARFSLLEPRVDTTAFRLDSFQSDLNNATAAWREQLGDLETSLTQAFQANLQQIIGDVDVVHREITESVQQQNAQWSVGIKEVAEKFAQDISNTAGNSQRMVAELKQEIFSTVKELDRSVLARHTEAVTSLNLKMDTLSDTSKVEVEEGFRLLEKKFDVFRNTMVAERASIIKTMEEERATVRKAHEEHTRCLNVEHEARVRENGEIRADLSKGFAEGRRVHQESHDQFWSMMDLEYQRRQECFENERAARAGDVQQIHEKIMVSINDLEKREVEGRNEQIRGVLKDWAGDKNTMHQMLNEQKAAHNALLESHQTLLGSHDGLRQAHQELSTSHDESRELQTQMNQGFEAALASERDARASELKSLDDAHRAEQTNLGQVIQGVQEAAHLKNSSIESKHDAFGRDLDSMQREMSQLIEQRFAVLEAKFGIVEPRLDATVVGLDATRNELSKRISEVNERLQTAHESLKQTTSEALSQQNSAHIEELSRQCEKSEQARKKISGDVAAVSAKCDQWKSEFTKDYKTAHTQLDRAITERYDASVNNCSLQLNKIVQGVKKDQDNALHELRTRIDELRSTLVQERNNHAKWMEEERTAFRKAHDEHVHIVEVERDARLRQIQDLRVDLLKSMKERDTEDKSRVQVGSQRPPFTLGGSVSTTGSGTIGCTGSFSAPSTNAGSAAKLGSLFANLKAATPQ